MENKTIERNDAVEIDVQRLFSAVMQRIWFVVIAAVAGAVVAFAGTFFFITPLYESSSMFYVNNSSVSLGDTSFSIDSGDITASKNLVNSYIVILETRETLNDVIDYAGVDRTYKELKNMIAAASVNDTEIFRVVVTSPDPKEADAIARAIATILPKRINKIIDGTSAKIVDSSIVASTPSSPSYTKNTIFGFLIGLVLVIGVIVLQEIFDVTIRSEEDMEQVCKLPVLASIPDMNAPSKGGYYKSRYNKYSKYATDRGEKKDTSFIGGDISFAASESYKLLRTKLQFSFADENTCHVIGLSSALSGEGKSLTAVNLAYTLAQLEKRVLLIDCDMRRPTLAEKVKLKKFPGLSGYLTGQYSLEGMIQRYNPRKEGEIPFDIITAGQNPPNPVELLSSAKMSKFLNILRAGYEYIILDLPPIGEVTDALAVVKEIDGMLLVVRQDYCDRVALKDAFRQFSFIDTKLLGIVYNATSENSGKYGKSYYRKYYSGGKYGKYYKRSYYDRAYGRQYEQDASQALPVANKFERPKKVHRK